MLADGRCVHISDVMAHAIEERLNGGYDPLDIEGAFVDLPAEIVGCSSRLIPRRIFAPYHAHVCRHRRRRIEDREQPDRLPRRVRMGMGAARLGGYH